MCLILIAWRVHPRYPCVIAANRDEFHARPTRAADWWDESNSILAGRDLQAGGTWLGITRSGRFAALTNYRDPAGHRPQAPTRGALVPAFLSSESTTAAGLAQVATLGAQCNAYNFLAGDGVHLGVHASTTGECRLLPPGRYALSNHLLDTPWPKVLRARAAFDTALVALPDTSALLELLKDGHIAPDDELPATGVSLELERLLSSTFIRAPGYGTRSSTLVRFADDGEVAFDEWSWDAAGAPAGLARHRFRRVAR